MKKVLYIGMTGTHGGTEAFVLNLIQSLDRTQFEPYVLDSTLEGLADQTILEANGVGIIPFAYPRGKKAPFVRTQRAREFFKTHPFDVVHIQANSLNVAFWAVAATQVLDAKVIVHAHNTQFTKLPWLKQWVFKGLMPLQQRALQRLDGLVCLAASDQGGRWMFGPRADFTVIPNGIPVDQFTFQPERRDALRKQLGITAEQKLILSVARFSYQKNQERIVEIMRASEKVMPGNFVYVFVGEGETQADIQAAAQDLPAIFVGASREVPAYYDAADALLLPSRYEAFPYTLVEAQASGLPALVSTEAVPAEANIVGTVHYASLAAPNAEWVQQLAELTDTPRLTENRIKGGAYDVQASGQKVIAFY